MNDDVKTKEAFVVLTIPVYLMRNHREIASEIIKKNVIDQLSKFLADNDCVKYVEGPEYKEDGSIDETAIRISGVIEVVTK